MAKIFDNLEVQERRLNEDKWFFINQPLLLWLANTDYGRDLLCIPKQYNKIIDISKRHITMVLDDKNKLSDFRIGSKFANAIRYRWREFSQARDWYYNRFDNTHLLPFKYKSQPLLVATTTTVYPDPDPESTTVDGVARRQGTDETFATIIAGAGTNVASTSASNFYCRVVCGTSSGYNVLQRSIFLYDTSAIPDTDVISSGTHSLFGDNQTDTPSWGDTKIGLALLSSNPATNTDIVTADYGTLGSTLFATNLVYSTFSTSAYNDQALNANGISNISKTGVSKFGIKAICDHNASDPGFTSAAQEGNLSGKFADQAGTTNDPKLVVTHGVAGGQTAHGFGFHGIGSGSAGGSHGF